MAIPNPLRAVWGYLRGDDLKAADARAIAAHAAQAALQAGPVPVAPVAPVAASARAPTPRERIL